MSSRVRVLADSGAAPKVEALVALGGSSMRSPINGLSGNASGAIVFVGIVRRGALERVGGGDL